MIKQQIFDILQDNYQLRKIISDKLNTRIVNIERWAQRKSIPKWYQDQLFSIIETELKLSREHFEC